MSGMYRSQSVVHEPNSYKRGGALGQIRTADTRFRRAVLYPLSYEGGVVAVSCRKP